MALITWGPQLSVNIAEIDRQHQGLMGMLNDLHDAMKAGRSRDVMGPLLDKLCQYTQTHFKYEEALFKQYSYPGAVRHKIEHDALLKKAAALQAKMRAGEHVPMEVSQFLSDWLNHHIQETDKSYSAFLNGKGVH